jgi:murein DD-endopeptidase MepM/ murein hydrolase activator NlpD
LRKKGEITKQISNINGELQKITQAYNDVSAQKNTLREQVKSLETDISQTDELITQARLTISQLQDQIKQNQQQLDDLKEQRRNLIREIQKQDKISPIQTVLTSKNLAEAMSRVYAMSSLQTKAEDLSQKIEEATQELEANKKAQEETEKTLQNTRYLQNSKRDSLRLLLEQTQGEEAKYQELLSTLRDQQKQLEAQAAAAEKAYQEELARANASNPPSNPGRGGNSGGSGVSGGGGTKTRSSACFFEETKPFPAGISLGLPTKGVITDGFGCDPGGVGHDGIDFANGLGTPIVSVAEGQVIHKGWEEWGFGHFVVVKHTSPSGATVYSLYAHLREAAPVRVGQEVKRGELLAYMGSTGNSSGPHLHFMLISSSFEKTKNFGCHLGRSNHSLCYDPAKYLPL